EHSLLVSSRLMRALARSVHAHLLLELHDPGGGLHTIGDFTPCMFSFIAFPTSPPHPPLGEHNSVHKPCSAPKTSPAEGPPSGGAGSSHFPDMHWLPPLPQVMIAKSPPPHRNESGAGRHAVPSGFGMWSHMPAPASKESSVQSLPSSHSWSHVPMPVGLPPQCQPAFRIPTPGSERMTLPSSLTVPVPMLTNSPRSGSKEYM